MLLAPIKVLISKHQSPTLLQRLAQFAEEKSLVGSSTITIDPHLSLLYQPLEIFLPQRLSMNYSHPMF